MEMEGEAAEPYGAELPVRPEDGDLPSIAEAREAEEDMQMDEVNAVGDVGMALVGRNSSSTWLFSFLDFIAEAAVRLIGFVGEQARSIITAISPYSTHAPEDDHHEHPMQMRVWYAMWEARRDVAAAEAVLGTSDRPRRSRHPTQPPGLASQLLRELEGAEAQAKGRGHAQKDAQDDSGADADADDDGTHPVAQLTCSQVSSAECAAAAATLARAAAAAAARSSSKVAPDAPVTPVVPTGPYRKTTSSRDASPDTCLKIAGYPPAIGLSVTEKIVDSRRARSQENLSSSLRNSRESSDLKIS